MRIVFIFIIVFLCVNTSSIAQSTKYNCVILDSVLKAIDSRKEQNSFILPLLRYGEIKKKGDSIYPVTRDTTIIHKLKNILSRENIRESSIFLEDTLFDLDTFNIIVDKFGFFDVSCKEANNRYIVVNDYRIIDKIKSTCNVIILEAIGYSSNGGISLALRNSKSHFVVIFSVTKKSFTYPKISITDKLLYDSVKGVILE